MAHVTQMLKLAVGKGERIEGWNEREGEEEGSRDREKEWRGEG